MPFAASRLLDRMGVVPVDVAPLVNASPMGSRPRTFVVTDRSDQRLKVRTAWRSRWAARAEAVARALGDARVPPPLARDGRVTVDHWIEGETIGGRPTPGDLQDAAELLASVHRSRAPHLRSTAPVATTVERLLEAMPPGLLTTEDVSGLRDLLDGRPERSPWGRCHGDFCGENLVRDGGGSVISIDNEALRHGYLEYDFARSWYRWALDPGRGREFERRYREAAGMPDIGEHERTAWRAAAALMGLYIRANRRAPIDRPAAAIAALLTA